MKQYILHVDKALVIDDGHGWKSWVVSHPFHSCHFMHKETGNGFLVIATGDDASPTLVPSGVTVFPTNTVVHTHPLKDEHVAKLSAFGIKKGASFLDALGLIHADLQHPAFDPNHS